MSLTIVLLILVVIFFFIKLILWALERNRYWKNLDIPYEKPIPFLGSTLSLLKISLGDLYKELYFKHKEERYFGMFEFTSPLLVIRDPELIGKITVKDFAHFVDHGFELESEANWVDNLGLFSLKGAKWRGMRSKILPAFTTGKLRGMQSQILESAQDLTSRLSSFNGTDVNVQDQLTRYTTEIIASVAFGLEGSRSDPLFREMGNKALHFSPLRFFSLLLGFNIPWIGKTFNITLTRPDVSSYFIKILEDTLEYRRKNNYSRNDFVQLLLQLKDKGFIEVQSKDTDDDYLMMDEVKGNEKFEITEKMLVAQAFVFILAGFEPLSAIINYVLLQLAQYPLLQEKVRSEAITSYERNEKQFNYQCLKEMTYLDMFIQETLRLYPIVVNLFRKVTKEYVLDERDGKKINLKVGTKLIIPITALHKDPSYWPEPEKFDPERFAKESSRVPHSYLPFGDGPRICIGMRFALLQIKQAVASILKEFKIEMSPKTKLPLQMRKNSITIIPKDPLYLRFIKI